MDYSYEESLYRQGYGVVAGIDEAGRGALAGPVVAAAVILPQDTRLLPNGIRDSKQLTPKQREALFYPICKIALSFAVGIATHKEIDKINILKASLLAMTRAVSQLKPAADLLLVDGPHALPIPTEQRCLVNGDRRVISIAAASIIAKVSRDKIMMDMHAHFPIFGFKRNMGYGTAEHRQAIVQFGRCREHRCSFRGVA